MAPNKKDNRSGDSEQELSHLSLEDSESIVNLVDDEQEQSILSRIESLVDEEPRTIKELHEAVGKGAGMSRDQVEYRATHMADSGVFSSKKGPGRTSPRIFWKESSDNDS